MIRKKIDKGAKKMADWIIILLVIGGYLLLQLYILPKMGIST